MGHTCGILTAVFAIFYDFYMDGLGVQGAGSDYEAEAILSVGFVCEGKWVFEEFCTYWHC